MNDNIDYERDFPELKFMRLTDAASAAAILKHAHTAVSSGGCEGAKANGDGGGSDGVFQSV